jgi:hypothetical protein
LAKGSRCVRILKLMPQIIKLAKAHYDAVGNLTNIIYPVSSNVVLRYDVLNRLTNLVDGVGKTIFSYDAASLLLSEDGPWTNDTISYSYTSRLRAGLSLLQPGTSAWTESYQFSSTQGGFPSSRASYGESYCNAKCTCGRNGSSRSMSRMKGQSI